MKIPGNAMIALRIPNNIDMVIMVSEDAKSSRMTDKVSSLTPQPEKLKGKKLLNNPVRTYVRESNWSGTKAA
jgi:type IV secretory pathway TrbF-like protein